MAANKVVLRAEADAQEWVSVTSSNVHSIAYAEDFARLYVKFNNGTMYVYHYVPPLVFSQFQTASSKGRFVWKEIRNEGRDDIYPYDEI